MECGYDCEFVAEISDDYICAICTFALREPLQLSCGHRFCKPCYNVLVTSANGNDVLCPMDRQVIDQSRVFPDIGFERSVLNLEVRCKNAAIGCTWTGELRHLEAHEENCTVAEENKKNELREKLSSMDQDEKFEFLIKKVEELQNTITEKNVEVSKYKEEMENSQLIIQQYDNRLKACEEQARLHKLEMGRFANRSMVHEWMAPFERLTLGEAITIFSDPFYCSSVPYSFQLGITEAFGDRGYEVWLYRFRAPTDPVGTLVKHIDFKFSVTVYCKSGDSFKGSGDSTKTISFNLYNEDDKSYGVKCLTVKQEDLFRPDNIRTLCRIELTD